MLKVNECPFSNLERLMIKHVRQYPNLEYFIECIIRVPVEEIVWDLLWLEIHTGVGLPTFKEGCLALIAKLLFLL